MASLFVSHSSHDAQVTAELVGRLRAAGFQALFVDFDPDSGIPAGRRWERELYAQLRRADGVLYVASPAANASRWCFAELSLARSLGKPIFPVLLAGPERLSLLADVQWVDLRREDREAGLQRPLHWLQRAGLDARDSFGWEPSRSPYPGLDPFGAEDAAVFFGRTAEIDELLDRLTPTLQRGRGQFLAVVGPSGSGKSSLITAGLLPRLARRGWATLPRVVPGERPLTHLARSLAQALRVTGGGLDAAAVERRLEEGGSPGLVELAQHLLDRAEGSVGAVVFVDQAEELITRTGPAERTRFLRLLRGALQPDSPLRVVATLRSEFLGASLVGAGLAEIVDDAVVVGPVPRERLFEVIEKPGQRAGLDFEAGLVARIVDDTVGGDSLPLLAYTLRQLYDRTEPGRPITHGDYEAIGGVVGALRRQADRVMRTLAPHHPQTSVLAVLLRLVSVERGGEPVRRRVRREALRADEDEIVQAFVDARLLRSDELDDEVVVEVAHEALLRRWEPLRTAVDASRRTLELRAEIEEDARSWDQAGREDSYLLRGVRLAAAEELSEDYVHDLGALEQQFLSASRARREGA